MPGLGSQPFGSSPYGIGTPAVAEELGGKIHEEPTTGKSTGSRAIDPVTRDYVVVDGRIAGMSDARQLVQLAVMTLKGSAAMRDLGHEFWRIERITKNIQARVQNALAAAVQHLVDLAIIEVVEVIVEIARPGVVRARLRWIDLSTSKDEETSTEI